MVNGTAPEQLHISLASPSLTAPGTHAITVSWVTHEDADSFVWYGREGDDATRVEGTSSRYTFDDAYTSPLLHRATLTGLAPGETYAYSCGDSARDRSAQRSFRVPPARGDGSAPFVLGVVGDLGQTADSAATLMHIQEEPLPLVVLHAGDLAYADCEQDRWDSYGRLAEAAAARVPWMTAAGNHEIELEPSTGLAFTAYEARYAMPAARPPVVRAPPSMSAAATGEGGDSPVGHEGSNFVDKKQIKARQAGGYACTPSEWLGRYDFGNSFYSFDVATAHVVVLNPYTPARAGSPQQRWLAADLAALDRSVTPWLIVITHCPWYNSNFAHQLESQAVAMKESMEGMIADARAALVISGHVHAYERTHPVRGWARRDGAPVYIVIGDGGNREGHARGLYAPPHWSAARDDGAFGHGRLAVANATHARWEWRRNRDGAAQLGDASWIVNPYAPGAR
ncbi:Metallo-dependent phosphatase-like protein [Tribonema minus]|uniref:Purple acid phosphatase n=1 Tax=Tribonema minus TaxID=303371 RepID=A0A835YVM8_9STRA|nr:Metallo-dependent phosphatase-like protein [Tribonema minus]